MRIISRNAAAEKSADWLLIELKNSHQRVISGLEKLDELLAQPAPDLQSYLALRRELSSASRARSLAVQAAHDHISERADPAAEVELSRALHARRQMMGLSADHLSTWSGWVIAANWSRHRSAQRALRSHWIDLIELEQSVLYPMLQQDAGGLGSPPIATSQ